MNAELIAVGTELLMGETINSNTTYLADWCTQFNINVYHHQIVGDNEDRLLEVFNQAWKRSDVVLVTGGLGPTPDDLTKQTIAKYFNKKLVFDNPSVQKIKKRYDQMKRDITPNNWNQAKYIEGGEPLQNPNGLAVGTYYEHNEKHVFIFPGPPNELREMFEQSALPIFYDKFEKQGVLKSRVLRLFGIGESALSEKLSHILMDQSNPTIALYAHPNEVSIRLTAQATTQQIADDLLNKVNNQILPIVEPYLYGYGYDQSLEEIVVQQLIDNQQTVATAESLTGGLLASKITSVPGASSIFPGGFVSYQIPFKEKWLKIPSSIIQQEGVVSAEVARRMAQAARELTNANFGIGLTGVAGPDSIENQPVGTVFISIATPKNVMIFEEHFGGTRHSIRERSVKQALFQLMKLI